MTRSRPARKKPPRQPTKPAPERLDRTVLTGLGLTLAVAGSYGVARGLGLLGAGKAHEPVLTPWLRSTAAARSGLVLVTVTGLSLLVSFLALRWLRSRFRSGRDGRPARTPVPLDLVAGDEAAPKLDGGAARRAVEREIRLYPGVDRVSARVSAEPPKVVLRLRTMAGCDVPALTREIDQRALPMLRSLLASPTLSARIEIRLGDRPDPEAIKREAQAGARRSKRSRSKP